MTTLYIIRHGETDWNAQGLWQGHTDVPLNAAGHEQAQRLATHLAHSGVHLDAIYSSDLLRAWETAQPIGESLGVDLRAMPALREIDLGSWSGMTREQVIAQDAETLDRISSGEDLPRGGGERLAELHQRVVAAAEQAAAEHPGGAVALVTHGGPVRALLMHAARDKDGPAPRRGHIGNTSVSVITLDQSGWNIRSINEMRHLEDVPQAPDLMSPQPAGDEEAAFKPQ